MNLIWAKLQVCASSKEKNLLALAAEGQVREGAAVHLLQHGILILTIR